VKIYTRTGDRGETGLFGGLRVPKSDPRVEAYGEVDELNAWLGLVRSQRPGGEIEAMLEAMQRDLFAVGAALADPKGVLEGERARAGSRVDVEKTELGGAAVGRLEGWIDSLEATLPPLRRFLLPGGSPAGAALHVARTVSRRAERRAVALGAGAVDPVLLVYLNRLSDLLFVMARAVNHRAGVAEVEW
jgi:cob(I)alamin adenosyltransferase